MTPFWNQTSPSNLIAASRGIVSCFEDRCGKQGLRWKVGIDARIHLFKCGTEISAHSIREVPFDSDLELCGIPGDVQGREFPLNRMELHGKQGHVGTVEIVAE